LSQAVLAPGDAAQQNFSSSGPWENTEDEPVREDGSVFNFCKVSEWGIAKRCWPTRREAPHRDRWFTSQQERRCLGRI